MSGPLPTFESSDWQAHVEAWTQVAEQVEERLWMLGAIAESLARHYGDRAIPEFAKDVNYSARRVWELAATYKHWKNRDRAQDLTHKHHTVAARHEDPEEAIEIALAGEPGKPGPLSANKLERVLKGEPKNVEVVTEFLCPECGALSPMSAVETREVEV